VEKKTYMHKKGIAVIEQPIAMCMLHNLVRKDFLRHMIIYFSQKSPTIGYALT